jgi:hypothetical protein
MNTPEPPIIERCGYTWLQHPDGLYGGPRYPSADVQLVCLELEGKLGRRSVRPGEDSVFPARPRGA